MATEIPKIYTVKGLRDLTDSSSGNSGADGFKGLNSVLAQATTFAKEVKSLFSDFATMKGLAEQMGMKNPSVETPQDVNVRAKIEKGVNNAPKSNARILYRSKEATEQLMQIYNLFLNSVDENKTIKEAKVILKDKVTPERIIPLVDEFLRKHTELQQ